MQRGAQTYGKVANQTVNQRELEASLLLKAASRLQAVHDGWECKRDDLADALLYNRRLWTIFITSVAQDDNPLPRPVREDVANLGLFVFRQTLSLIADPRPEYLGSLVNINRQVAAGLQGRL
ncbi:MAG TPA: flagellar biosynthesis regulator FlaF [Xanthobacteraceae bacterium]|jgi:flagellar protein FlaF|nr:flagellar biosynthesis regulator FlaF [Xanthobacteraceae bacterium]